MRRKVYFVSFSISKKLELIMSLAIQANARYPYCRLKRLLVFIFFFLGTHSQCTHLVSIYLMEMQRITASISLVA